MHFQSAFEVRKAYDAILSTDIYWINKYSLPDVLKIL